ncbi:MAG: hypothetical protein VYA67_10435 [Actinomycetota bacterium]|uniref:ESX-1 secretion-associated protein EspH n=1 Tax=Mycobacterium lentiflavum TaxID=141349 RepID=A0ABY3UPD2_MYCLN|nr:hypothetical protein [Mycobacterium lentiflavum]MEE3064364.1 hypothetical protein [Actinomycetota bacterium]ULP40320.1 hypothetical protein MJO58_14925 [Mycobacterium lentiflavum]
MSHSADDQEDISALVFFNSNQSSPSDDLDRQALIFGDGDDGSQGSAADALRAQLTAEPQDTTTDVDAIRPATHVATDDSQSGTDGLVKVTNPAGSVSAMALVDGSVVLIDLSPKVTKMSEAALADEILVVADLARQQGLAAQQTFMAQVMQALRSNIDLGAADELVASLKLPTQQQADAAQAEVFATRYAADTD